MRLVVDNSQAEGKRKYDRAWFPIFNDVIDHPVLTKAKPYCRGFAYVWMCRQANHASHTVEKTLGDVTKKLNRGQIFFSMRFMAEAWGWKETAVRRFLSALERAGLIEKTVICGKGLPFPTAEQTKSGAPPDAPPGAPSVPVGVLITICKYNPFVAVKAQDRDTSDAPPDAPPGADSNNRKNEHHSLPHRESESRLSIPARDEKSLAAHTVCDRPSDDEGRQASGANGAATASQSAPRTGTNGKAEPKPKPKAKASSNRTKSKRTKERPSMPDLGPPWWTVPGFEEAAKEWPDPRRLQKQEACFLYIQIIEGGIATHEQIIRGIKGYAEEMSGFYETDRHYTTMANWLKGRRWEDECGFQYTRLMDNEA
jgi:hypothetical protein